jgi:hypothetical protein
MRRPMEFQMAVGEVSEVSDFAFSSTAAAQ